MRKTDARIMLFASSFDESRGNSCICLYTASKASSLYDQVFEYAFDTYNVKMCCQGSYRQDCLIFKDI